VHQQEGLILTASSCDALRLSRPAPFFFESGLRFLRRSPDFFILFSHDGNVHFAWNGTQQALLPFTDNIKFIIPMKPKQVLLDLKQQEGHLYAIHYSCQTLGDGNEGLSPRITSIAVLHLQSSSMHSFSIHLVAERKGIKREDIPICYDDLEGEMLQLFYAFVQGHPVAYWLHWNMSNINYGFEAIAHRYAVLTKQTAPQIPDSKRFNLSTLISGIYGDRYVDHPKMLKLMELNGGRHRDFLTGQEEAETFESKEYIKLHKSTMSKTYWFQSTYYKLQNRKLVTTRTNFWNRVNEWMEHPFAKLLGFVSVLYTLSQFIWAVIASVPFLK
jgi:hypothetical protein